METRNGTIGATRSDKPTQSEERELWVAAVRAALSVLWLVLARINDVLPRWMWVWLGVYMVFCFFSLVLVHRRVRSSARKVFNLLMDIAVLTAAIYGAGASLSFWTALFPVIVIGYSLMSGRTVGAIAVGAILLAYGGLLLAEAAQWLPPSLVREPSTGPGSVARLLAFCAVAIASVFTYFLLAISIKSLERYASKERQLLEAESLAKADSEKLAVQLEQAKRLEGIGRLAGGVAHEFNNLLTVILGYSRFVSDELPDNSPLRDDIREVVSSAERAATLTSQLLAFGRKQMFRKRLVDISTVVSAHGKRLAGELAPNVELDVVLPGSEMPALVDPTSLDSMVDGLVSNALEAMPEGGKLRIRLSRSTIGAGDRVDATGLWGDCAVIEVSDTGVGMDEKVRSHLFEPFFTTKSPSDGRGMGLATIYGAARQHGGSVEAESERGVGSTFRIILPIALGPDLTTRSSAASTPPRPVTVLLVEDEELVRRVTARILKKAGYTVHQAADAKEALALLETERFQLELLVTDIIMPGKSGIELAAQLHEKWPALPVLFVSGYTEHQFAKSEEPGGDHSAFLPKPFSEDGLLHELRVLLGRSSEAAGSAWRA
ncbi:MAG: response regulator [Myxococcota bacterium]|jgi:signal transduction histidine kinase/ActR/RegA family two-component response regulator|nr:response regulator [Myxococcota bacterium]